MTDKEIISMLLNRNIEINNKISNAILDILRLGYNTERGKQIVPDLIESINYTLEEIDRIIKR